MRKYVVKNRNMDIVLIILIRSCQWRKIFINSTGIVVSGTISFEIAGFQKGQLIIP